ncbi:MAG: phosphate acyltransferase PlsX, partial [Synechococcaceae cyanobacterium]
MPPKEPEPAARRSPTPGRNRNTKPSRAIRRLVIWYRRNPTVTGLVGSATATATATAGEAGSVAGSVLHPLVFEPLRPLQQGGEAAGGEINDHQ